MLAHHPLRLSPQRTWAVLIFIAPLGAWGCSVSGVDDPSFDPNDGVAKEPVVRAYDAAWLDSVAALQSSAAVPAAERPGLMEVDLVEMRDYKRVDVRATLDTSAQVLRIDVPKDRELVMNERTAREFSPPLKASMADATGRGQFRSASMLAFKAKQFDDGLYAAVELAADAGVGRVPSRRGLIADIAAALATFDHDASASGLMAAAAQLGGHPIEVSPAADEAADAVIDEFMASPLASKPLGFYTWSAELTAIFRRDRLLQRELSPEAAGAFVRALEGDDELMHRYRSALDLPRRLTNEQSRDDLLRYAEATAPSIFPPSRAYETDLIKKLYGDRPIPDDFDLADEMVRRIRAGQLDLSPRADSGWYDHQTWALEPLVIPDAMPEAQHLKLTFDYKQELIGLFKSLLALTRETHVKQLETPMVGAAMPGPSLILHIKPRLTQEPLASFYLRRALSYRFVRGVLEQAFGADALSRLRRATAAGPVNLTLDRELRLMEGLFHGAYMNTAFELGMSYEAREDLGLGSGRNLQLYRSWNPTTDPDVSRDVRMMVPVFYDIQREKVKVWAVLGVTTKPIKVSYATPPEVKKLVKDDGTILDPSAATIIYTDTEYKVAYPVMAEVYVSRVLDRDEFRKLCDEHRTQEAILQHLEK